MMGVFGKSNVTYRCFEGKRMSGPSDRLEAITPPEWILNRRTTADWIGEMLREAICTGSFRDGEVLNQVELAEHFGVSRIPMREALRQLQSEGLVELRAHHKAVVSTLSPAALAEIYEIRELLEVYLLTHAFPHIDEQRITMLERLCDRMEMPGMEDTEWLPLTRQFHDVLFEPSGRKFAMDDKSRYRRLGERYIYFTDVGRAKRRSESNVEHRSILAAVREGDLERASDALSEHVKAAGRSLVYDGERSGAISTEPGPQN